MESVRTLVIETATEACSVALFDNGVLIANDHRELGRGHAERLIPMIADLPDKGKADRILVSRGPGSFTGVRIGIAAARALALAWQSEIEGYPTLALIAAMAGEKLAPRPDTQSDTQSDAQPYTQSSDAETGAISGTQTGSSEVLVCMAGGHGEWFVQPFAANGHPLAAHASMPPQDAVRAFDMQWIAGSQARVFIETRSTGGQALPFLPDASYAMHLPRRLLSDDLKPIYGREPDAKPAKPVV